MSLIDIFTDYVVNKKSLKDYVEVRKTLSERGEFNDTLLCKEEDNLQRLKAEDEKIYNAMYCVLKEIFERDQGHYVEYPINFIKAVLKMYENGNTTKKVYDEYARSLEHRFCDA